nr:MAG TPA: hypothetical protein [Crassvirales sp.]
MKLHRTGDKVKHSFKYPKYVQFVLLLQNL